MIATVSKRAREARHVAFAIDDGTGRALIDPTGAKIKVVVSERQMILGAPTARQGALLAHHGISGQHSLFREGVLVIGMRVAVIGRAVREPDPDGAARASGYRGDAPTRLRLGGSVEHPLEIRDAGA